MKTWDDASVTWDDPLVTWDGGGGAPTGGHAGRSMRAVFEQLAEAEMDDDDTLVLVLTTRRFR